MHPAYCGGHDIKEINEKKVDQQPSASWQKDEVPNNKKKRKGTSPNRYERQPKTRNNPYSNYTVETSNRFEALSNSIEENEDIQPVPKPQPIFATGIKNITQLRSFLQSLIKNNDQYTLTTMRSGHIVKISPSDIETYKAIRNLFLERNISHYTYQLKHERAYRVFLRGMHHSENIEMIKDEIEKHGHTVRNIVNIRHRATKDPLPLFAVDLEPKSNNQEIMNIQFIDRIRVNFEAPYTKKEVVQCKRCQRFGHTRNSCNRPFRCVKCSGDHPTVSCTKTLDTEASCVNCAGKHPASYRGCEKYQAYKRQFYGLSQNQPAQKKIQPSTPNEALSQETGNQSIRQSRVIQGTTYADVATRNTRVQPEKAQNNTEMIDMMQQMFNRLEKMMERMMDKMFDRMIELVTSKFTTK